MGMIPEKSVLDEAATATPETPKTESTPQVEETEAPGE